MGPSLHDQQLTQNHPELLRAARQFPHPLRHVPRRHWRWVLQCCRLGADHDVFEFLTECVAALGHPGPDLRALGLARQRVADEHQLVRAEDDELAVCHEDFWWLVGVDGGEEGVDGIGHCGDVLLALLLVEEEELPVAVAEFGGGGGVCGAVGGQWVKWRRGPARHVIVDWPAHFLFQLLELFNLEEMTKNELIKMNLI